MNKRIVIAVIFTLLTAALTVFIFSNSLREGTESAKQSDVIVEAAKSVLGVFGMEAEQHTLSLVIRKLGHFSEYFALGLTSAAALSVPKKKYFMIFSPIYCAVIAICDEFIMQRITEGRAPQWTDVLIDCGGALLALCAVVLFLLLIRRKEKKNEK